MSAVTRKFIGLDWNVPVDEVRREPYGRFNYFLDEGYRDDIYPDLWRSVFRGLSILAYPTEQTTVLDDTQFILESPLGLGFIVGEVVIGEASGSRAIVKFVNDSISYLQVGIEEQTGLFTFGETLRGQTSGSTGVISISTPTLVRAMAAGRVIYSQNGGVGIYHENDGQSVTSFYIYVNPTVSVGDSVDTRATLGTIIDRGVQTSLIVELYDGYVNSFSESSLWGQAGARRLNNDQYLLNPADVLGSSFAFIRFDPKVELFEPAFGPIYGGTSITVRGSNFLDGIRVFFGTDYKTNEERLAQVLEYVEGVPGALLPDGTTEATIRYVDDVRLVLESPPSPIQVPDVPEGTVPGLVDVVFVNPESGLFGRLVSENAFRYEPLPEIISISPTSGPEAGGTIVSILGSSFRSTASVRLLDSSSNILYTFPIPDTLFVSSELIRVVMPPIGTFPSEVYFQVVNSTLEVSDIIGTFRYLAAPVVDDITYPPYGIDASTGVTSGTSPSVPFLDFTTTIYGSGFRDVSTDELIVNKDITEGNTLDGVNTVFTVDTLPMVTGDDTNTPANLPAHVVSFTATKEDGTIETLTVTSVDGSTGEVTVDSSYIPVSTDVLRISYYTNAGKTIRVYFGENPALIESVSSTEIVLYYPQNAEGIVKVKVDNPDGQKAYTQSSIDAEAPERPYFTYVRNNNPVFRMLKPKALVSTEEFDTTYPEDSEPIG